MQTTKSNAGDKSCGNAEAMVVGYVADMFCYWRVEVVMDIQQ